MNLRSIQRTVLVAAIAGVVQFAPAGDKPPMPHAMAADKKLAATMAAREHDWRQGALVYQVIVDRFAPAADLEAKRALYPEPKKLRRWDEVPARGTFVESANVWSHEIDFWGGDLQSLRTKLDYIDDLGVDVLYLNPIHAAYTNHKYDAQDYFAVSPEYGTRKDVKALAAEVHRRGMHIVLDGVFNHMGRTSPAFQEAMDNPKSAKRGWFFIGPEYELGYRAWVNVPNLPELRLENKNLRERLWGDEDSVVRGYLRDGIDGWRLDVAFDIGPQYLRELTKSAQKTKRDALVLGELWNYPEQWFPSVVGTMNMPQREIILRTARGEMPAPQAGRILDRMIADAGTENMLRSWVILDNHDTPRLRTAIPDQREARLAQVLQFTLPGSPCIYYGVELGMTGGDDPEMRGPMRWDLVRDDNADLAWMRSLIKLRRDARALRVGDFRLLESDRLMAFQRSTERAEDTVVIVVNNTDAEQTDTLMVRDSKLMSFTALADAFTGREFTSVSAVVSVKVPAKSALVLRPKIDRNPLKYTPYKRVL